jgi:site-specific DNA-methyltransferase (adenine-specific)
MNPRIEFYIEDAVKGLKALPPQFADTVITSPPYNIGTDYSAFDDTGCRDDYLVWTSTWVTGIRQMLKPQGSIFLNISGKPTDPWVPYEVALQFKEEFTLQNVIHWTKSIAIDDETHGHYKPINSKRFLNDCHEYIFHFTMDGNRPIDRTSIGVPYTDRSNLTRWSNAISHQVHCRGNNWFIPYPTRNKKKGHPATYPQRLVEMCLLMHGMPPVELREGFQCVDPFMGSGTTAKACARYKVNCLGFEIFSEDCIEAAAEIQAQYGIECPVKIGSPEYDK